MYSSDKTTFQRIVTNRWLRLISFGLAVTFTTCLYAGWQQYSLMLLKGGKYLWLCDESFNEDNGFISCLSQEEAVARLFAVAASLESFGAIFAGFALDRMGPRWTALIGGVLGFVATVLMVESRQGMNSLHISMVLTGISINLIAFPALILEDWFPSAAATTAAYVISCQCLSCIVAPVMWELWKFLPGWSFRELWYTYLGIVWIPISLIYTVTLPLVREAVEEVAAQDADALETESPRELTSVATEEKKASLVKAIFSSDFLVLNIANSILMIQSAYYQVIVRPYAGQRISDFVGWGLPTQALWGILLGRAVDVIKTPAMTSIIFAGYAATYIIVQFSHGFAQYLGASCFIFFMSYAYTVKYSYIQERFPTVIYGRLIGVAGAIGGAGQLLTNILVGSYTYSFWCSFLAAMSLVGILMSTYLSWSMKKHLLKAKPAAFSAASLDRRDKDLFVPLLSHYDEDL